MPDEQTTLPGRSRAGGAAVPGAAAVGAGSADGAPSRRWQLGKAAAWASPRRLSVVYFFTAMFTIFSVWVPGTFLTASTWHSLLANQAITGLVAVAFSIPIAAGAFDLAVGSEVGFGGILVAWLIVPRGLPVMPAIALTLIAGGCVGLVSGLLVVRARIDAFIATLAMSSILLALVSWVSGGSQILGMPNSLQAIATNTLIGIAYPVWILLAVTLVAWYVLEWTSAGRSIYATGGNPEAARLAGVRTSLVTVLSLIACGIIAGAAGILSTGQLAVGDPTAGPGLLLPAIAGVFLGSTQFRGGRVSVWGSVLAIYALATGTTGLQLAGAPTWISELFDGVALLIAVGVSKYQRRPTRRLAVIRRAVSPRRAR